MINTHLECYEEILMTILVYKLLLTVHKYPLKG